jgi:hypothetical protein
MSDTYERQFDFDSVSPSSAVVETLAAVRGRRPEEMDPLYDHVDPEALDDLLQAGAAEVSFPVGRAEVTVTGDGTVTVRTV